MKNKSKKILFINFGGLGDEILFLPTISSIKKEFPNSEITLALEPRSKNIVTLTNIIDNILTADIKCKNKYIELIKLLFKIWSKNYDIVISSGGNKFISLFLFLTFIPEKYGYNSGKLSELLLTKAVKMNKNQYAACMYHDLIKDITNNVTLLPQFDVAKRDTINNSVLIHPGVSLMSIKKGIIKTVPAKIWAEVVEKLASNGKNVILAGGPDDKEVIDFITNNVPSDKFTNMYGKTKNLEELAELISSAETFICSDSAPLHIAVGMGVKTFVIFGSTDDKKLIPQCDKIFPIKAKNCTCPDYPCLWERRQQSCNTLECLNISSDDIVNAVLI